MGRAANPYHIGPAVTSYSAASQARPIPFVQSPARWPSLTSRWLTDSMDTCQHATKKVTFDRNLSELDCNGAGVSHNTGTNLD